MSIDGVQSVAVSHFRSQLDITMRLPDVQHFDPGVLHLLKYDVRHLHCTLIVRQVQGRFLFTDFNSSVGVLTYATSSEIQDQITRKAKAWKIYTRHVRLTDLGIRTDYLDLSMGLRTWVYN